MKLQTAIDRLTLEEAVAKARLLDGQTDIIEMGTSLVKDYGNEAIRQFRQAVQKSTLLVDEKTIDEGAYEFRQGFENGADILTVMGAASKATLATCYEVAQTYHKTMMIDLMEVSAEKLQQIADFDDAIYCLHHSTDRKDVMNPSDTVAEFHQQLPHIKRLAIAGGIDLAGAKALAEQGLTEIVIVGSKIMKAADITAAVQSFKEVL
ncbi:orotidine 5'-phosphate decarboxylase / HUMPS family protein [Agrilactobacillus fermenti]|uniref:orotidine 5'-phosphate decarboxylase / HUMPS family protein n=1 Tax=Agrilactobacillus fermenti TaxID=2586909 RepID=UPI001E3355BD|nr:orotidine 5'-phosphate decarboxylase / HUMPS family protein [Agrilactobacillus fermenti]MCD2257473.1 orotidine 5'-phosphate decarboxylase [Agrilactobacillus fermenti]